jgi:putative folate metabolism gamma-glutamate ligase
MLVKAIKTRPLIPPQDDLLSVIKESLIGVKEKSIIIITSKVVSIWEGRCVKGNKDDLIKQEADLYLDKDLKWDVALTIKNNILIPTAGIDESNANGYYILWPEKPFESAKKIYDFIKKEFGVNKFGVIISDSHTTPLRTGIMGIAISFYGFNPLRNYVGKKDIFGRKLKMSQTNIADSLAAAAVYTMGEGAEQTPIAIIEGAGNIEFSEKDFSVEINPDDDIYSPLLKSISWKKKK